MSWLDKRLPRNQQVHSIKIDGEFEEGSKTSTSFWFSCVKHDPSCRGRCSAVHIINDSAEDHLQRAENRKLSQQTDTMCDQIFGRLPGHGMEEVYIVEWRWLETQQQKIHK